MDIRGFDGHATWNKDFLNLYSTHRTALNGERFHIEEPPRIFVRAVGRVPSFSTCTVLKSFSSLNLRNKL